MDWSSWLSESSLEPSSVYDYSLLFANNELEESDAAHFDHEFLFSMGISVAKHRLDILKLAKKKKKNDNNKIKKCLVSAVVKTKKRLSRYLSTLAVVGSRNRCDGSSAIVIVQPVKAAKRLLLLKHGRFMIAGNRVKITRPPLRSDLVSRNASPSPIGGGMRWDSMFQDLKPT